VVGSRASDGRDIQFIDWLVSPDGQKAIAGYKKAIAGYKIEGQQLFFPNAEDPSA
jgi:tungstate transport system substrate-binding protein